MVKFYGTFLAIFLLGCGDSSISTVNTNTNNINEPKGECRVECSIGVDGTVTGLQSCSGAATVAVQITNLDQCDQTADSGFVGK